MMPPLSDRLAAAIIERIKSKPFQEVSPDHYQDQIAALIEEEVAPLVDLAEAAVALAKEPCCGCIEAAEKILAAVRGQA